ncbi:MAG: putative secreted protein [Polyangiaceae bacterium]|jgi:putative ABC transport system permease protein|nr:putative secreted protein [Polyangiaceae bacterium]
MIPISYNVRSLFVRKTTTFATAGGIALVVFVLAAAFMLSAGVSKTLVAGGRPDNAIVTRKGADNEMSSSIEGPAVSLILATPGVKKDETGAPLGGGEVVVVIAQDRLGGEAGQVTNILVRGVSDNVLKVRPDVRMVDGRPAKPGTDEVIIGKGLVGKYRGMTLGDKFELKKNRPVTVVGVFEAGGSSFESEVWANLETARSSFGREGLVSSVTVRLDSPAKFDAFKATIETDKQLLLEARRETKYYEDQSQGTAMFVKIMGIIITFFCATGATLGAMNTMFAAVAQRKREVGTLRALGFSQFQILTSFVIESTVLAVTGGVIGMLAALLLTTTSVSMMNFQTWQEITFSFAATPDIMITCLVAGIGMGVLGGFFPALKAAGTSPIEAMRG